MKRGKKMSGSLQTRQDVIGDTLSYYTPSAGLAVQQAMECAVKVHELLGLRDYSRCDFRLDESGAPYCMEVSTHPDIDDGCSFVAAALQSISSYQGVIEEIVLAAMARETALLTD
jgi:D-alanine-D-alanine ligase